MMKLLDSGVKRFSKFVSENLGHVIFTLLVALIAYRAFSEGRVNGYEVGLLGTFAMLFHMAELLRAANKKLDRLHEKADRVKSSTKMLEDFEDEWRS